MARTAAQIETSLTLVRAAIDKALQGGVAEYQLAHGQRVRRYSLAELRQLESELEMQLQRVNNGAATTAVIRNPS